MFIRTQRLFLRPGWAEDAAELTRAIAHEPVVRMLAHAPWPYAVQDAAAFLESAAGARLPSLLVTLPEDGGRIVGGCALREGSRGAVEVGYWVTPQCWGRGYAREALAGLANTAGSIGHHRLTARHSLDTPASGKVLRAAGFRPTGRTIRAFSLSRRSETVSVEYALDLMPASPPAPDWTRPAAYRAGAGLDAAA